LNNHLRPILASKFVVLPFANGIILNSRIIILSIVLIGWLNVHAQLAPERTALKNLARQKWEKASGQLQKVIRKDTLNTAAPYVMAQYYFAPANPSFQVDSAYRYLMIAMKNFQRSFSKSRDRLKKFPVDSVILIHYRERIDSAAFVRAKGINVVSAYDYFLANFPFAADRDSAVQLRNEVAYEEVLKLNTYVGFKSYMEKYPDSKRLPQAIANYERLLYADKTKDKKLSSYRNFIREYPATPYRNEIEKKIFEISVAAGSVDRFEDYLKKYPTGIHARQAKSILFHLLKEDQRLTSIPFLKNDSLNQVLQLEQNYLVPFLHNGMFGLMDQEGEEVLHTEASEIDKVYTCGNIVDDIIVLDDQLVARNGVVIYQGEINSVDDIGSGFLLVDNSHGLTVIHKTGFKVGDDSLEDARLLQGKLLALRKDGLWSVWTLTGFKLQDYTWNDIIEVNSAIALKQDDKYKITSTLALAGLADQRPLSFQGTYDEVKPWNDNLIWCRNGISQGVLDQNLKVFIPFNNQILSETFSGIVARQASQVVVYTNTNTSSTYHDVVVNKPWQASLTNSNYWQLTRPLTNFKPVGYDSVYFSGPFAVGVDSDTLTVHFNASKKMVLKQPVKLGFIPGQDSSTYLLVDQGLNKTIFNQHGKKLFSVNYDKIVYGGGDTFIVLQKEKRGLVNAMGKLLLPVEFDAIGTAKDGVVSLLKSGKFGLYSIRNKKLIKPAYAKNLVIYNKESIIAFKDGAFGFIDWNGKPLSEFQFAEIQPWSDSVAWVKSNRQWSLYEVGTKRFILEKVKDYKVIQDHPGGKLAIVHQENQYGVLHSKHGFIIPVKFSDVVNVGSPEVPMYFTEKHVEEASIFVVIYYSHAGKMIRKEVYEQDDYEKIYCSGSK